MERQQRAPRRVIRLRVSADLGRDCVVHGFTHNLSSTGVSIELDRVSLTRPAPVEGEELTVSFRLPHEEVPLRLRALVVWTMAEAEGSGVLRIGARYVEPAAKVIAALSSFVATFRFAVLVIDGDPHGLELARTALAPDYHVVTAGSLDGGLDLLRTEFAAAILCDADALGPAYVSGLDQLDRSMLGRYAPRVLMSSRPLASNDEELIRKGSLFQVIGKPLDAFVLRQAVHRAVHTYQLAVENERLYQELERALSKLRQENTELRRRAEATSSVEGLVGDSAALRNALGVVQSVQHSHVPVYLHGESGTGKELVARAIHFGGPRAEKPFIAHNCAATSATLLQSILFGHKRGAFTGADRDHPGLFEQAHGGSLFLDEVADLSSEVQAALLRVAQDGVVLPVGSTVPRAVDVRLISASNRDLHAEVQAGRFRADLFFRLVVVQVDLPPLRERRGDVPLLTRHFLRLASERYGHAPQDVTPAAMHVLESYTWPGNIRELANEIERAVVLGRGGSIDVSHLSPRLLVSSPASAAGFTPPAGISFEPDTPLELAVSRLERHMIVTALARVNGNQSAAARQLGLQRATLRYRMAKFGLDAAPPEET